jgi:hypothetical protein
MVSCPPARATFHLFVKHFVSNSLVNLWFDGTGTKFPNQNQPPKECTVKSNKPLSATEACKLGLYQFTMLLDAKLILEGLLFLLLLLKPLRVKSFFRFSCDIPIRLDKEGMTSLSTFNEYQWDFVWETDVKMQKMISDIVIPCCFSLWENLKTMTPVQPGLVVYLFVTWFDWGHQKSENSVSSNQYSDNRNGHCTDEMMLLLLAFGCLLRELLR